MYVYVTFCSFFRIQTLSDPEHQGPVGPSASNGRILRIRAFRLVGHRGFDCSSGASTELEARTGSCSSSGSTCSS